MGFFAAHGVLSVEGGQTLVPLFGSEDGAGARTLTRIAADDLRDAAAHGQELLDGNPEGCARAVLVLDGYVPLEGRRTDALVVRGVAYAPERATLTLAVPYRPRTWRRRFAVLPLLFPDGVPDADALGRAFVEGVTSHEQAARVWSRAEQAG